MSHNRQKKIAVINDLSGYGRCSLAVAMPVISYLGVQCCPVPTSIFSNHTGFKDYFFDDYTDRIDDYISKWHKLNLTFEGIASGFLGSKKQIETVIRFIEEFRSDKTTVIVDPVMGDHGRIYRTYTDEMCEELGKLVACADIITPNLTECCKLTDTPYKPEGWKKAELHRMGRMLLDKGPDKVVITGIPQGGMIANYVMEKGKEAKLFRTHKAGIERSGTGDLFASIIAADAVNNVEFSRSVKKASGFVKKCIMKSEELAIPQIDGVCFEEELHTLKRS
ncbi:pyridoxamine kinase [Kineothrix sp. MB12-C1]|uniref:pyridoxamine kinase n=1 Tax=Kineothrix sp. MB12-C1 TaxID=3070215 RepID=UPI0027D3086D|nr:pyridoxamine kinase [Kineothrix sp. MB12-C1]WMC93674.1 pyridoxamine kinase [Kineothrix sp. MB12-C1]